MRRGFIPDEALELSNFNLKLDHPIVARMSRRRLRYIRELQRSGLDRGEVDQILDDNYLRRAGDMGNYIEETYEDTPEETLSEIQFPEMG